MPPLALRERHAALLAARGLSNKVIAADMGVGLSTVATLLRRASRKLGVKTRVELGRLLAHLGPSPSGAAAP